MTLSRGLVGVSMKTMRVVGRQASRIASASSSRTGVNARPAGAWTSSNNRRVPPYISSPTIT
jgi:hypothetical protein